MRVEFKYLSIHAVGRDVGCKHDNYNKNNYNNFETGQQIQYKTEYQNKKQKKYTVNSLKSVS